MRAIGLKEVGGTVEIVSLRSEDEIGIAKIDALSVGIRENTARGLDLGRPVVRGLSEGRMC